MGTRQSPQKSSSRFIPATGWDVFLPVYDYLLSTFTPENTIRRVMTEHSHVSNGQLVVDAGCGTGTHLLELAARYPDARLCGIDIDVRVLRMARKKFERDERDSIELMSGSVTQLPLQDRSVQLVVSTLVFHHLLPNEKKQALMEIRRVLAADGTLLLTDLGEPSNFWRRLQFLPVRVVDGWKRTACNVAGRLPHLLHDAGFEQVEELFACNSLLGTIRIYRARR